MELKKVVGIGFFASLALMVLFNVIAEWKINMFFTNVVHKISHGQGVREDSYIVIRDLRIRASDVYAKFSSVESNESDFRPAAVGKPAVLTPLTGNSPKNVPVGNASVDLASDLEDDVSAETSTQFTNASVDIYDDERTLKLSERSAAEDPNAVKLEFSLSPDDYPKVIERIPTPMFEYRKNSLLRFGVSPPQLQPLVKSGIQNSHPFGYTITSNFCEGDDILMLIYVHSAPHHFHKRQMIRSTWGNVTFYRKTLGIDIRMMFTVAMPTVNFTDTQKKLYEESEQYHDILQEKYIDSYHNLTYKAVGALRYITKHCTNVPFIMKTDDDIFANTPNILKNVIRRQSVYKTYKQQKKWLYCRVWRPKKVDRDGKWEVSHQMFAKAVYPSYCQGAFYVMTFDVARALYLASYSVPFLWVDDAYMTGVVRSAIGIHLNTCPKNFRSSRLLSHRGLVNQIKYIETGAWKSGCIIGLRESIFQELWNSSMKVLAAADLSEVALTFHSVYEKANAEKRVKKIFAAGQPKLQIDQAPQKSLENKMPQTPVKSVKSKPKKKKVPTELKESKPSAALSAESESQKSAPVAESKIEQPEPLKPAPQIVQPKSEKPAPKIVQPKPVANTNNSKIIPGNRYFPIRNSAVGGGKSVTPASAKSNDDVGKYRNSAGVSFQEFIENAEKVGNDEAMKRFIESKESGNEIPPDLEGKTKTGQDESSVIGNNIEGVNIKDNLSIPPNPPVNKEPQVGDGTGEEQGDDADEDVDTLGADEVDDEQVTETVPTESDGEQGDMTSETGDA